MAAADAFAFVMPEYNHGYTAPLKNAIDFLNAEWQHKPVGFVSYGGVAAGTRAVQLLKPVCAVLGLVPVNPQVNVPFVAKRIDGGTFTADEPLTAAAGEMLDALAAMAGALRSLH